MKQCEECNNFAEELIMVSKGIDKNDKPYTHNVCDTCAFLVYGWPDEFGPQWSKENPNI